MQILCCIYRDIEREHIAHLGIGPGGFFFSLAPDLDFIEMRKRASKNNTQTFQAFYKVLKPGGKLGLTDHRLPEDRDDSKGMNSGYVKQSYVIKIAEAAGFKLEASSEINANAKDTADHPEGVWTLPPSLALKETDKEKYLAIGESDRMTLLFVKAN